MGWRVAVTRDDNADEAVRRLLEDAGFVVVSCPVLIEGPPPDPAKLLAVARDLERFDWIVCASTRAVRAIADARGSRWPSGPRTAAVGPVTAAAMRSAGADPVVGDAFTAASLLEQLRPLDTWTGRRVLIATVKGGRRELIDGLGAAGALVTEIEAYTMMPRPADDIRRDWQAAQPDAVLLGSADTARVLVDAIGVGSIRSLKAIVPIGPTTAAALATAGVVAEPPPRATFAAAVEKLRSVARPSPRSSR